MLTPHPLSGRAQDSPTATGSPGAPEGDAESGRAQRLSQLPDAYDLEALDRALGSLRARQNKHTTFTTLASEVPG